MMIPRMLAVPRKTRPLWWCAAVLVAASCSLQDFDYLQDGTTTTSGSTAGGSGGTEAGTDTGGEGGVGGSTGGSSMTVTSGGAGGTKGTSSTNGPSTTGGNSMGGSGGSQGGAAGAAGSPDGGGGTGADGNLLVNGSFEEFWTGWSVEPPEARGNYANVKWPQPGSFTPNGEAEQNLLGTWHMEDAFVVSIFQVLDDLDDGLYTFKGFFNWGGSHNAVEMFAKDCGTPDIHKEIPATADTQWIEVGIGGIEVVGGHCEVGFMVDSNPQGWLNADMFSFERDPQ